MFVFGLSVRLMVQALAREAPAPPHTLDLLDGEGRQLLAPEEPDAPDAAAIRERQVPSVRSQLPPHRPILDRAAIVSEAGRALRARTLSLAGLVKAPDRVPGAGGGSLAGLRGEG